MVQALQKWQLLHITACIESWAMYKSLLMESIPPVFNISSQIHKGSISWHQQHHKQYAHNRRYQLISFFFFFLFPMGANRAVITIKGKRGSASLVDWPPNWIVCFISTQSVDLLLSSVYRRIAKLASELTHLYNWLIKLRKSSIPLCSHSIRPVNYI